MPMLVCLLLVAKNWKHTVHFKDFLGHLNLNPLLSRTTLDCEYFVLTVLHLRCPPDGLFLIGSAQTHMHKSATNLVIGLNILNQNDPLM